MVRVKKYLVVLVAAAILLAACGDDGDSGTEASGGGGLDTAHPFKLGLVLSSSGAIGVVGPQALLGVKAAVEELNANGGILGRKVEIVTRDSKSEVNAAVLAAQDLMDNEKVDYLLPDTLTANSLGILPLTTDAKLFTMNNASGLALNDPAKFPYEFVFSPSKPQDVAAMVSGTKELVNQKKINPVTKVAMLLNNNGVKQIVEDAMKKQFGAAGWQIVSNEVFEPTASDITVQLQKIRATNPDILMLSAVGDSVVVAMNGLRDIKWDIPVFADSSSALQDLNSKLPTENKAKFNFSLFRAVARDANATTVSSPIIEKLEKVGEITSLYVSTLTYDITTWVAWAVNKAGKSDGPSVQKVMESVGGLPDNQLPAGRALKLNPGYTTANHSLGGGDLSQAWAIGVVGPLIKGTFPKLVDVTIPAKVD